MNSSCAICCENFVSSSNPMLKKNNDEVGIVATHCGHIFHNICIKIWLKKRLSCPECRKYVGKEHLTKLFNFCRDETEKSAEDSLNSLEAQLYAKDLECAEKDNKIQELQAYCASLEKENMEKDKEIQKLLISNERVPIRSLIMSTNSRRFLPSEQEKKEKLLPRNNFIQSEEKTTKNKLPIMDTDEILTLCQKAQDALIYQRMDSLNRNHIFLKSFQI